MKKIFLLFPALVVYALIFCGSQGQAAKTADRTPLAKEFINLLSGENYSKAVAMFDEKMKEVLPEGKLKEIWQSLLAQAGSFKTQGGIRTDKVQNYDVIFVTCEFEKAALEAKVVFDSTAKIAGLFFVPQEKK
jgi:hypothetical protein